MGEGKNNISKTSKILGILRKAKTHHNFEDLIINELKRIGFRYRRLKAFLSYSKEEWNIKRKKKEKKVRKTSL
jgi:hypothetical protein